MPKSEAQLKSDNRHPHDASGQSRLMEQFMEAASFKAKPQRSDPTTSELPSGEAMVYTSDGSTGSAGDLIYAVNDSGTIKTSIVAQRSNAT